MVTGCFGKTLCSDYGTKIASFTAAYLDCDISITSKAHIIMAHLKPFLDKHQTGLALWSEQAFEAVHSKFRKVWEKYKVKDKTDPKFFENLLKAVLDFNGNNIV